METFFIIILMIFGLLVLNSWRILGNCGCVVMLPALYFLFNYNLPVTIGTTITAVIITATSGSIAHIKIRNVDYKTAIIIATSGAIGALLGSIAFQYLVEQLSLLKFTLGAAFLYVSLRMIYEGGIRRRLEQKLEISFTNRTHYRDVDKHRWLRGYALVPSMTYLLGSPVKIAVGTSLASFISMTVISGAFKIYQGLVDVVAALSLGAGTAIGAQISSRLVPKVPASYIKLVFGVVFLYVSLKLILSIFGITI